MGCVFMLFEMCLEIVNTMFHVSAVLFDTLTSSAFTLSHCSGDGARLHQHFVNPRY